MNVLECEVRDGVARLNEPGVPVARRGGWSEAAPRVPALLRAGFPGLSAHRYQAILRRTYFLGIMLRIEVELASGLILRSRITKEEYARLNLSDGVPVSFQIRQYRVLGTDSETLSPEVSVTHDIPPNLGEGI